MRATSAKVLLGLGLSAVLTLTACGDGDAASPSPSPSAAVPSAPESSRAASATPSGSASPSATPAKVKPSSDFDDVTVTGAYGKEPKVEVDDPWAIDKTRTKVLDPGDGPVVEKGATVEVDYYGVDGRTGKKFDDSFSRGAPVAFPLDQVVPGFSKGLEGQRQGSRVVIAMPGSDGYDASGGRPDAGIEVGDTLIFVVDIRNVPLEGPSGTKVTPKKGLPTVRERDGQPVVSIPKSDPPAELQVQPLVKGKGAKVGETDTITFDYRWVAWRDGRTLEESYSSEPANAALSSLLPGMQKGLAGQTVGSRLLLVIPPADGYPDGNADPKVEPGETLVMVVDLLFTQAGQPGE